MNRILPIGLFMWVTDAIARGSRGGSGHLLPWWQIILCSLVLIVFAAMWRSIAGKVLLIIACAVAARELWVNWP